MRINSLGSLKDSNRRAVLAFLRRASPLAVADIARASGLSKVTVMKCIDHFVRDGQVLRIGQDDAAEERGKRPVLYAFNHLHKLVFCVKIDEVHLLAALTGLDGKILASHSAHYAPTTPLADVMACIRDAYAMLLDRADRSSSDCIGAVVGCHGVIDPELGICFVSPHFSGWGVDIPIRRMLEELLPPGIPVHVNNWIQYHAYGEMKCMTTPVNRFFLIGTEHEGVAGGLVIDGRMYRGSGSLSGEIAHVIVDTGQDAERCECGGRGCLEASVSPRRMERRARSRLRDHPGSILNAKANFADIAAAATMGDPFARSLMDEAIGHWSIGITNILHICDPQLIIFQGDYSRAGDYFLSNLAERIQHVSLLKMRKTVELAYSELGDNGTILGAGAFCADLYFDETR